MVGSFRAVDFWWRARDGQALLTCRPGPSGYPVHPTAGLFSVRSGAPGRSWIFWRSIPMLRKTLRRACGFGLALRVLCMPWVLLCARIWFGQVVFVHQIMTMAEGPHDGLFSGGLHVPSGLDAALHSVVPLLLTMGLLTRPVALVLLVETIVDSHGALAVGAQGAKLALLSWLIVSGAGAISLDSLLGRGLSWIPFRPIRLARGLYVWFERYLSPLLHFVIRVGLAASLVNFVLPTGSWLQKSMLGAAATALVHPAWCAVALALALALGCATRLAALVIAVMGNLIVVIGFVNNHCKCINHFLEFFHPKSFVVLAFCIAVQNLLK